jgi:hypothetical protein
MKVTAKPRIYEWRGGAVLRIRIHIKLKGRVRIRIYVISWIWIRIRINLQMASKNVGNMSLFEHFFKVLSL